VKLAEKDSAEMPWRDEKKERDVVWKL